VKRALFRAAVAVNHVYRQALREVRGSNLQILPQTFFAKAASYATALLIILTTFLPALLLDAVVLSKIRAATGGRLRATISGGGALPLHIDEFFNDIGIAVLEGYGMTENVADYFSEAP
jgi:long-chain acyl-CoA synthetase